MALCFVAAPRGPVRLASQVSDVVVTLSGEQLNWLLDGYDVLRMKAHKSLAVAQVG